MLLSIGMIVKNEEKYLEQCLTALQPILNSLDSELIIADTGSTDNTVEIAKKFTDNVFYFEWINDFAAARNSTLERAKGEWYMFIDADEIFRSCDNIIKFFKSGEYQKYTFATYIQRNYSELGDYSNYNDRLCGITRLFKCGRVRRKGQKRGCSERNKVRVMCLQQIFSYPMTTLKIEGGSEPWNVGNL